MNHKQTTESLPNKFKSKHRQLSTKLCRTRSANWPTGEPSREAKPSTNLANLTASRVHRDSRLAYIFNLMLPRLFGAVRNINCGNFY